MVWAIDGDGCFQMTAQELVTATAEQIPVKVAILNNAYLAWCGNGRRCSTRTLLRGVLSPDLPDYVKWLRPWDASASGRVPKMSDGH